METRHATNLIHARMVNNFGVKKVKEEHAEHLMSVLQKSYTITHKWKWEKYIGITLDWDHKRQVHLSMPRYIEKALHQFNHHSYPTKRQHLPYPCAPVKYGVKIQYSKTPVDAVPVGEADKKFIQQVCGKFLYYGRTVDGTILTAFIASKQANPTTDTMARTTQLLDYLASQEEAILTYLASNMVLSVHSDAGYLNEIEARGREGGHFFLSSNARIPSNNGAILNVAQNIKNVMSLAAEAELSAIYIMAQKADYIRHILKEMGHKQPATSMQTDSSTAEGVINSKIQPKQTKQ